jgi:hypothetical protein
MDLFRVEVQAFFAFLGKVPHENHGDVRDENK